MTALQPQPSGCSFGRPLRSRAHHMRAWLGEKRGGGGQREARGSLAERRCQRRCRATEPGAEREPMSFSSGTAPGDVSS